MTELWLQWNTGTRDPSIGKFLGLYTMFVVIGFIFQLTMFMWVLNYTIAATANFA